MRRKSMGWSLLPKIMDGKHEKEEEEGHGLLLFSLGYLISTSSFMSISLPCVSYTA